MQLAETFTETGICHKLPVQALKFDRCFVAAMTRDEDAATIVRSAISLGKSLG